MPDVNTKLKYAINQNSFTKKLGGGEGGAQNVKHLLLGIVSLFSSCIINLSSSIPSHLLPFFN